MKRTFDIVTPPPKRRWGAVCNSDDKLNTVFGFPTAIRGRLTAEQLDAYLMAFRIQEITAKLQANEYHTTSAGLSRCPSPEPEYDSSGRRTNTREKRYRKALEDERHTLVEAALETIPNYQPPYDYHRPKSFTAKVFIPVAEFPTVNFIGQILGPRGSSLKALNKKAEASIVLRGKGSIKEGRGHGQGSCSARSAQHLGEPLHCLIVAASPSSLERAKQLVKDVIDTAKTPDDHNERKRQQLRDLAVMNGTFRDYEKTGSATALSVQASSSNHPKFASRQLDSDLDNAMDDEIQRLLAEIEEITPPRDNDANKTSFRLGQPLPPWRANKKQY
ncbi:hypothetical protein CP533_5995 [Ophiocordyceps camponoti-saundersi (nom. inval.)]|nr:hypothetical protein CP533_5995 [Ophiocordyceps camponoti-saundersi (nom. inval.)]